jgi:hypothetical protein
MEVVEVQEEKEWMLQIVLQPSAGSLRYFLGGTFQTRLVDVLLAAEVERAVVKVETLIQPKSAVESDPTYEPRRSVAA